MSDDSNKVAAEPRDKFGKGAARKIRAAGKIPAVIYGHGSDPEHVTLPAHQVGLILRKANAVIELALAGKSRLVLVKDVQKDPVRQIIEHLDLIVVRKGEKVIVDVPVHVEGESYPGTIVAHDATSLSLEVEATEIPERVLVSVEGLEEGSHMLANAVPLPAGSTLLSDPELLVIAISVPSAAAEPEAAEVEEGETEEGEAEPNEGAEETGE